MRSKSLTVEFWIAKIKTKHQMNVLGQSISNQVPNEPKNKPNWWQPLEYYESMYGESGKERYEGQFDMLKHFDSMLG